MVTLKTESCKGKEWRDRIERFAVGGLQVKVFCQREGVSEAVFRLIDRLLAATGPVRRRSSGEFRVPQEKIRRPSSRVC